MSRKQVKAIIVLVLSFIIIFGNVVPIQAAIPSISTSNYIKAYVLSTGNNTPVYTDSSLWVRGTASPYRKYSATVYASDEIYIYSMTSDYAYISYPTSSGRRKGYIRTSSITSNNKSVGAINSRAKITTYKRAGGAVYGNIDAGDKVYTLAASGSYVQVVYPISRGYKMGWITSSDYNNYIANPSNNTNTIADGYYQIKSAADTNYVLDISGASTYEGASALIWQNGNANNTTEMNQKFKIEKASGNYYYIKYAKSNQCLDVYNGEMSNETDIIQWPHHGADNQLWQIEKTADGYYTIKSKLNGLYMDVYKCDMSNGTNVQCYQWNGGMNQKWVLSPAIVNGGTINNNNNNVNNNWRTTVVNYMNEMASIEWTPSVSFKHWSYGLSGGNNMYWRAGTTYYGIPYSQKNRRTNLELFKNNMNGKKYVGLAAQTTYLGSDCSSAVSLAYQKADPQFGIYSTYDMFPVSGIMRMVGNYNHYNVKNASVICANNGKKIMQEAYRQLQAGDLVVNDGHVMMVTGNTGNSITVTHQTTYSSLLHSTWRVNESYTYNYLFNKNYIPVTNARW